MVIQKFASQISGSRSFARIQNLIDEMARKLSGANNLFDVWFDEIDRLRSQRRYPTRMLRVIEMVLNTQRRCENAFDLFLETATKEEWREVRQDLLRRMFLKDREVVAAAAKQAGVTVIWSESGGSPEAA